MTAIIIQTLAGIYPENEKEHKANIDHCESIIEDCIITIQDGETPHHDRNEHIKLRAQARKALSLLKTYKL
jgi:hypothetical protein